MKDVMSTVLIVEKGERKGREKEEGVALFHQHQHQHQQRMKRGMEK